MLLWKRYSNGTIWVFLSSLLCSFHHADKAIRAGSPHCDENFINRGHVKGEYRSHAVTGVSSRLGDVSVFLVSWEKKKGMSARDGEVRGTAAERDIIVDGRGNTSIRVSCDASPACPFQGKNGRGGWWMAPLTGEEQSRVSPKGLRGENDYFLAKWFWLELHLNLAWTLNQYSNTEATVWLSTLKGRDFNQTWISWFGYTESSLPFSVHRER